MLELGEFFVGEGVEVGDAGDEFVLEEPHDDGVAEAFDVHDAAGGEVEEAAGEAGGAIDVDAAVVGLAFGAVDLAVADGAVFGEVEFFVAARVLGVFDDFDDFGDDVAAALDFDVVADEEAEALDLVGVVESGAGDGGAADGDGCEDGDRGELAGAADLGADVFDLGDAAARGELEGDGPARGAAGVAEAALHGGGVDLDDDAVDFVTETVTSGFGFFDEGEDLVDGGHGFAVGIDAEAESGEGVESFGLLLKKVFAGFGEQEVGVEVEPALGDDVGLERADGSGGVVARIGGGIETLGNALFIGFNECGERHDDFAADFEGGGDFRLS